MAQYTVPQDVEADDKLIGPFNFRQFIYLLIVAALGMLAWALFELFPFLAISPSLPAAFFLVLALPLRKDQPMETYVATLISFYTKPNKRLWNPGQRESTITITAPKIVEKVRTKNLSEEEASQRLSFLANVIDSEGQSIKGSAVPSSTVREEFIAEADSIPDIFENYSSTRLNDTISFESDRHHAEVIDKMRSAIESNNPIRPDLSAPTYSTPVISEPIKPPVEPPVAPTIPMTPVEPTPPNPTLINLSGNDAFTVATIAKEADRKTKPSSRRAKDNEVYISLH